MQIILPYSGTKGSKIMTRLEKTIKEVATKQHQNDSDKSEQNVIHKVSSER